jgi:hypothetical protein
MSLTVKQFDRAFAEFQLFGPRRRIPIEERWREVLPEVDLSELNALKRQCEEIEAYAVDLAVKVRDNEMSDEAAQQQLHPKISSSYSCSFGSYMEPSGVLFHQISGDGLT